MKISVISALVIGALPTLAYSDPLKVSDYIDCRGSIAKANKDPGSAFAPVVLKTDFPKNAITILTPDGIQVIDNPPIVSSPQYAKYFAVTVTDPDGTKTDKVFRYVSTGGGLAFTPADDKSAAEFLALKKDRDAIQAKLDGLKKIAEQKESLRKLAYAAAIAADDKLHPDPNAPLDQQAPNYAKYLKSPVGKEAAEASLNYKKAQDELNAKNQALEQKGVRVQKTIAKTDDPMPGDLACGGLASSLKSSDGFNVIRGRDACKIPTPSGAKTMTVKVPVTVKCGGRLTDISDMERQVEGRVKYACETGAPGNPGFKAQIKKYQDSATAKGFGVEDGVSGDVTLKLKKSMLFTTNTEETSLIKICEGKSTTVHLEREYECTLNYSNKPCEQFGKAGTDAALTATADQLIGDTFKSGSACSKIVAAKACEGKGGFDEEFAQAKATGVSSKVAKAGGKKKAPASVSTATGTE